MLDITKKLCQEYDIKPARERGQNFLVEESVYDRIVEVASIGKSDIVMEVGPGLGFLTMKLARIAKDVVAVELDKKLVEVLKGRIKKEKIANIKVIQDDVLDVDNNHGCPEFDDENYKIVANLPYNITSVFLRKFLSTGKRPQAMVLMLQKEVAERIVAKPGKMSLLAVSVQFYAEPSIVLAVPKENFWPEPQVDSAVISLVVKKKLPIEDVDKEKEFFRLVKFGFAQKRKMLKNNLAAGYQIEQKLAENYLKSTGLESNVRAQNLSLEDWLTLFGVIKENML